MSHNKYAGIIRYFLMRKETEEDWPEWVDGFIYDLSEYLSNLEREKGININEREILIEIRDKINNFLSQDEGELQHIGTFYGESGKYDLYLYPKSTEKSVSWYEADEYCKNLGGSLPTIGELQFIYGNDLYQTFEHSNYWSSTEHSDDRAYYYGFSSGFVFDALKDLSNYVRAVERYY